MTTSSRVVAGMVTWLLLVGGCSGGADDRPVLYAAASLAEIADVLVSASGADVEVTLAGSSTLARQIVEGGPSGVFLAADERTMDQVVDAGLAGVPFAFATNRLVLVARPGLDVRRGLDALADASLTVGLCAASVPCGSLARDELARRSIVPAIDTEEADVRALTRKVVAGEVDLALVYATDALAFADEVSVVETDLELTTTYLAAAVGSGTPDASARRLLDALADGSLDQALVAAGFGLP